MPAISEKELNSDFIKDFKGDDSGDRTPRQTPGMLYAKAEPSPVKKPKLLAWSYDFAEDLDIKFPSEEDIEILGGSGLPIVCTPTPPAMRDTSLEIGQGS